MSRAWFLSVSIAAAVSAASTVAEAEGQEPVSIHIEGTIACTSENDFFAQVRRRAPGARNGQPGEPTRRFTISLAQSALSVRGRLEIVHLDGRSSTREVRGEACGDVVDALALITAVDIDPDAARAPLADRTAPEPLLPMPETQTPSPPSLVATVETWHFAAGVEPSMTARVTPRVLWGLPVYAEISSPSATLWSPSFLVGFERTFNSTAVAPEGDAALDMIEGFLQVCPIAWTSARMRAGPCLRFDAGRLEGVAKPGKSVIATSSESRAWYALGLVGRARFHLGGPVYLGAQLGLGIPLVHYQFVLDPQIRLGEVESWNWRAGLGLSVRFL